MDINCDLGEGIGRDNEIMPFLNSCNIACGGHTGDRNSMLAAIRLAKEYGVKIGAHPSFEDRKNFGRAEMYVPTEKLRSQLIHQIAELRMLTNMEQVELNHVKPHGALYNMASESADLAQLVVGVMTFFKEDLILYVPFGSELERKAKERGIPYATEAFADRNYDDKFRLMSRNLPNAVLTDPDEILARVSRMFNKQEVVSTSGKVKTVTIDTVCVHGDNPRAVEIAKSLHNLKNESF